MTSTTLLTLSICCLCTLSSWLQANEELALVSSARAYIVGASGEIENYLPGGTVVKIEGKSDGFIAFQDGENSGRLSSKQVRTGKTVAGQGEVDVETLLEQTSLSATQFASSTGVRGNKLFAALTDNAAKGYDLEYGSDNALSIWLRILQARALVRAGAQAEALPLLEQQRQKIDALAETRGALGIDIHRALGEYHRSQNGIDEALEEFRLARQEALTVFGAQHAEARILTFETVKTLLVGKRMDDAESATRLLADSSDVFPEGSPEAIQAAILRAGILYEVLRTEEAINHLTAATKTNLLLKGHQHDALNGQVHYKIGATFLRLGAPELGALELAASHAEKSAEFFKTAEPINFRSLARAQVLAEQVRQLEK